MYDVLTAARKVLQDFISQFGVPLLNDSELGMHFTVKITKTFLRALNVSQSSIQCVFPNLTTGWAHMVEVLIRGKYRGKRCSRPCAIAGLGGHIWEKCSKLEVDCEKERISLYLYHGNGCSRIPDYMSLFLHCGSSFRTTT